MRWSNPFLQRVNISCYAERCTGISYIPFVRPSVRHSPVSCQNYSSYIRSWGLHWRITPWL